MARYKHIDTSPRFPAVELQRQLLPGTFEYALNRLLDHELDLSGFDARFCNDVTRDKGARVDIIFIITWSTRPAAIPRCSCR